MRRTARKPLPQNLYLSIYIYIYIIYIICIYRRVAIAVNLIGGVRKKYICCIYRNTPPPLLCVGALFLLSASSCGGRSLVAPRSGLELYAPDLCRARRPTAPASKPPRRPATWLGPAQKCRCLPPGRETAGAARLQLCLVCPRAEQGATSSGTFSWRSFWPWPGPWSSGSEASSLRRARPAEQLVQMRPPGHARARASWLLPPRAPPRGPSPRSSPASPCSASTSSGKRRPGAAPCR